MAYPVWEISALPACRATAATTASGNLSLKGYRLRGPSKRSVWQSKAFTLAFLQENLEKNTIFRFRSQRPLTKSSTADSIRERPSKLFSQERSKKSISKRLFESS